MSDDPSGRSDRELADLLRDALHQRAEDISTSPDGLRRIRERTHHRKHRFSALRNGGLIAATAAAAVAAIVLVPRAFSGGGGEHHRAAGQSTTARVLPSPHSFGSHESGKVTLAPQTRPRSTPEASPSPTESQPPVARTSPAPTSMPSVTTSPAAPSMTIPKTFGTGQSPDLNGQELVWPYSNVVAAQRAAKSGKGGASSPESAARSFVSDMTRGGGDQPAKLSATKRVTSTSSAVVTVSRTIQGHPHSVCTAKTIAVTGKDSRRYWTVQGVASADGSVQIRYAPPLSGDAKVTVAGFATARSGARNVDVAVGTPGNTHFLGKRSVTPKGNFKVPVLLRTPADANGVVMIWTVDKNGDLLSMAAKPTG